MRRIVGRPATSAFIACVLAACLVLLPVVALAAPTNAKIRAKQADAALAETKLQDLNDDLELKQTDLEAVKAAVQATRDQIVVTEQRLAAVQSAFQDSEAQLASRADFIYRSGSVDVVEVLFGTSSFEDFVTRLDLLNRITTSDAELVAQVEADRNSVAETKVSLQNRESEEVALREQAQAQADLVEASFVRQQSYVASLAADIKKLMKEESDRRARAAAELARRAAEAATHPSTRPSDAGDLGASHPEATAAAKRYLGVRYLWGGTTPSGFDCSGFVQYAYREVGISLPRTSRTQFTVGQFIPPSRTDLLESGDLVFFGYGGDPTKIHHVGMYVGGGVFIHAPGTGDFVKYSSLTDRISSRSDYVGAVRP
ncbi:MAG TPA: NlpC/P60 family protein [Coriobacteriia bacterium]